MSLEEKRIAIPEKIQMIDESTLDAILELMDSVKESAERSEYIRRLNKEVREAEEDISAGRVYSQEQARKIMKSWK